VTDQNSLRDRWALILGASSGIGAATALELAARRHPGGRITAPEDAARAIAALADERTAWVTGNIIGVDGAEDIIAG
jgi:enoyl-[acyl-carrier protein] reductase III